MTHFSSFLHVIAWIVGAVLLMYGAWMVFLGGSIIYDKKERGIVDISFLRACGYALSSKMNWHFTAFKAQEAIGMLRKGEWSILVGAGIIITYCGKREL